MLNTTHQHHSKKSSYFNLSYSTYIKAAAAFVGTMGSFLLAKNTGYLPWQSSDTDTLDATDTSLALATTDSQSFFAQKLPISQYHIAKRSASTEFQVNTVAVGQQTYPDISVLLDDSSLIVWDSQQLSIEAQLFNPNTTSNGPGFRVNTYEVGNKVLPALATLKNGNTLITWMSNGGKNGEPEYEIYGRTYDGNANPLTDEFHINEYNLGFQSNPSVADLDNGGAVVVWDSWGADGDNNYGIRGRVYDANSQPTTSEFGINTYIIDSQNTPSVTAVPNGFFTAWGSHEQDGNAWGIYAQISDLNGGRVGSEFRVNEHTTFSQDRPRTCTLTDGSVVVVWQSDSQDGSGSGIFAKRYHGNGTVIKNEFQVNTNSIGGQYDPDIAALPDGGYVIAWESIITNGLGIYGQRYNNNNQPIGNEFLMSTGLNGKHGSPRISGLQNADGFIVTWVSQYPNEVIYRVMARKFGSSVLLTTNNFLVTEGEPLTLDQSMIFSTDADTPNTEIIYTISDLNHAEIREQASNTTVTTFSQQAVIDHQIQLIPDNSENAPTFTFMVSDGVFSDGPYNAEIVFQVSNDLPILLVNRLTIAEGQQAVLTSFDLKATDEEYNDDHLVFIIENLQHGYFESNSHLGVYITTFIQQQINAREIVFTHDGSNNAPYYEVIVDDGQARTEPASATIVFYPSNDPPKLINHQLTIQKGETIILSSVNLNATDEETVSEALAYTAINIVHGQFAKVIEPNISIVNFTQGQINQEKIQFTHDNSDETPEFSLLVYDGRSIAGPFSVAINYINRNTFELIQASLLIHRGDTVILSPANLNATSYKINPEDLSYRATNITHGQLAAVFSPNTSIVTFTQGQINQEKIQFTHDNSDEAPGFSLYISDHKNSAGPFPMAISFVNRINGTNSTLSINENLSTQIAAPTVVGLAMLGSLIAGGFWYRKLANDANTRQQHQFADFIRQELKLKDVDNFQSQHGQKYVGVIQQLSQQLAQDGLDINTMSQQEIKALAKEVALTARSKITTSTTFFGYSIITVENLERNIIPIAKTVLQLHSNSGSFGLITLDTDVIGEESETGIELGNLFNFSKNNDEGDIEDEGEIPYQRLEI